MTGHSEAGHQKREQHISKQTRNMREERRTHQEASEKANKINRTVGERGAARLREMDQK